MEEDEIKSHLVTLGAKEFSYFIHKYHQSSIRYTPYTLTLTKFSKLEKDVEYFTVSHNGLTRFAPDGRPELIPHEKWQQEKLAYKNLKKLKLFSTFIIWRAFRNWRKSIMNTKLEFLYKTLPPKLLWNDAALGPTLKTCTEICCKLKMMGLGKELKAEPLSLSQLLDDQANKLPVQGLKLIQNLTQIQNLKEIRSLFTVLRETMQDQLVASCKFAMYSEGLPATASSTRPSSVLSIGSGSQIRQLQDAKHSLSYADQEKRIILSARLARFVRLVDCLLQHTLHSVLLNSFREFVNTIEKRFETNTHGDAEKMVCLCKVEVSIEENELALRPSQLETINALRGLFQAWEDAVNSFELFSNDQTLSPYLRKNSCKTHLLDIVTSDENIAVYKTRVRNILETNFQMANSYMMHYSKVKESHLANIKINVDDISSETDPQYFENLLQDFKEQEEELEKIENVRVVGIFELHMEKLKAVATPCLLSLKNFTNSLLPKIGRQKVSKMSAEVQDAQAFLELLPKNTANFVEFLNYFDNTVTKLPQMQSEIEYLECLFDIMKKFNVACMKEDITSFTVFQKCLASLQASVTKREKERPEIVRQFEDAMKIDVEQIVNEIKSVLNSANEPILLDIESDVEEVQLIIHQLHSKLNEIERKNEYYKAQKSNFQIEVQECTDLEIAKRAVELRKLLWDSLEAWNAKVEDWEMQPFDTIDPSEFYEFINSNVETIDKIRSGLPENSVIQKYEEIVENRKLKLPVIKHMRNENLQERHWMEIGSLVKQNLSSDVSLTLRILDDMNVFARLDEIKEISIRATMEANLKEKLSQMTIKLESLEFDMKVYGDSYLIAENAEFENIVNDTCIAIDVIANSDYAAPIMESVTNIKAKFDLFTRIWEKIMILQKLWVKMDLVFNQDEVRIKLAMEFRMFVKASNIWFSVINHIYKTSSAVEALIGYGILSRIELGLAMLEQITECLASLLEQKRNNFPRFHFLSDDELLEFLAKPNRPKTVNELLPKMFSSMSYFKYKLDEEGHQYVEAVCSANHELLALDKPLLVTHSIDSWMTKLDFLTSKAIKVLISSALVETPSSDSLDVLAKYSQQVLLAEKYIRFTQNVERAMIEKRIQNENLLSDYAQELESLENILQTRIDSTFLNKISTLIATHMHLIRMLESLMKDGNFDVSTFSWQKCMRYYWNNEKKNCRVKIGLATVNYGFEFVSSEDIFICSAETEKTLVNLLFSMQVGLANFIFGGVAQSKKYLLRCLAKMIGVNYLHFPSTNKISSRTLTKILYGTVQSGSWCCISNIHNLTVSALSSLAQNIDTVLQAAKTKITVFQLEGKEIKWNKSFGLFLVASHGVETKLPKNLLKAFRPTKISSPNEALLVSSLIKAKTGKNEEATEILARWDFYKCEFSKRSPEFFNVGNLIKSINLGEIGDNIVFNFEKVLCQKLLTRTKVQDVRAEDIQILPTEPIRIKDAIEIAASKMGLILTPLLVQKVINLHNLMEFQDPVIIYGDVGCGKTTVWKLFLESKNILNSEESVPKYNYKIVSPGMMASADLTGSIDHDSGKWKCGLLKSMSEETKLTKHPVLLVFDGDLENKWIQHLGSIFERKNRFTLLENGEKVYFPDNVRLLIETTNLKMASPELLSRCNVLLVEGNEAANVLFEAQSKLKILYYDQVPIFFEELEAIHKELASSDITDLTRYMHLIAYFLVAHLTKREQKKLTESAALNIIFKSLKCAAQATKSNLILELLQRWKKTKESKKFTFDDDVEPNQELMDAIIFETGFETKISLMQLVENQPILINAPTGCGKTSALHSLQSTGKSQKIINFIATAPIHGLNTFDLQSFIFDRTARRSLKSIGAPNGHRINFMIDDFHIASSEQCEFLRMLLDHRGIYDKNHNWIEIEDVNVILTANTDSAFIMCQRLARHFLHFNLEEPSKETLLVIFESLAETFEVCGLVEVCKSLIETALSIYFSICELSYTKAEQALNLWDLHTLLTSKSIFHLAVQETEQSDLIREVLNEAMRIFGCKMYESDKFEAVQKIVAREFISRFGAVNMESQKICKIAEGTLDGCNHSQGISIKECLQEHFLEKPESIPPSCFLFNKFSEITARVAKALKMEKRSVLLFGDSGVGKRMIAKCSAQLLDYTCIHISMKIGENDVEAHLKKVCLEALTSKNLCLIVSSEDSTLIQKEKSIICLVKYGYTKFFFEDKFMKEATALLAKVNGGFSESENLNSAQLVAKICGQLKKNLKIILCVTSCPAKLADFEEARYCFVQFIKPWTAEDHQEIAKTLLKIGIYESNFAKAEGIETCLALIHLLAKESYVKCYETFGQKIYLTVCMYLDFLQLFNSTYDVKIRELRTKRDRCAQSIKKLEETFQTAEELKQELSSMVPRLKEKRNLCEQVAKSLLNERSHVEKIKLAAQTEETALKEKSEDARILGTEIQRDLDECIPAIEASCKALEMIERNELKDIKTTNKPSSILRLLMEPVCLLLGCKSDWGSAKALVADANFIKRAIELDKENVPEATAKKLKEYVDNPNFLPEVMESHSRFCRTFCMWVRAIHNYVRVYRGLMTKKRRLELIEGEIRVVMSKLKGHQHKLADTDAKVAALEVTQDQGMAEADALSNAVEGATVKLKRASQLASALAEFDIWKVRLKEYNEKIENLYGDILLCAATVTYLGPLNAKLRTETLNVWRECCTLNNIKTSANFCFKGIMKTTSEIHVWHSNKLMRDENLVTSAIIVDKSRKMPLIVDPQGKAGLWLRNFYGAQGLFTTIYLENYLEEVEKAIDQNCPVLVQDVNENIPPKLITLIGKKRAEGEIRICLVTRNPKPNFSVNVFSQFNVIDFTITPEGLENLLLDEIIHMKYPDVESQLSSACSRLRAGKRDFDDIVSEMQEKLCQFKGDLLEDEIIINSLCKSKSSTDAILVGRERHLKTWKGFAERKNQFRSVAKGACDIFSVLLHMHNINPIYQFSFQAFKMKFIELLKRRFSPESDENLKKSTADFKKCVVAELINDFAHSFCKQDLKLFCYLTCYIFERRGGQCEVPNPNQISLENSGPEEYSKTRLQKDQCLAYFQELLNFDPQVVNYDIGNLKEKIMSMRKLTPFLMGQDVSAELRILANELRPKEVDQGIIMISLGKGQMKKAEFWLRKSVEKGLWVYFQNCQLEVKWLQELERYFAIYKLDPNLVHENFRMFFSVNSDCTNVPPGLTQASTIFSTADICEAPSYLIAEGPKNLKKFCEILQQKSSMNSQCGSEKNYQIVGTQLHLNHLLQNVNKRRLVCPGDYLKYYIENIIFGGYFTSTQSFQTLLPLAFEENLEISSIYIAHIEKFKAYEEESLQMLATQFQEVLKKWNYIIGNENNFNYSDL